MGDVYMPEKFNPKSCPVGIANAKEIEKVDKVFSMAIQRIDKKLDELGNRQEANFKLLDNRLDDMSKSITEIAQGQIAAAEKASGFQERLDSYQSDFDKRVDARIVERIDRSSKNKVFNIARWVVLAVGGVGVSILTAAALRALNLA